MNIFFLLTYRQKYPFTEWKEVQKSSTFALQYNLIEWLFLSPFEDRSDELLHSIKELSLVSRTEPDIGTGIAITIDARRDSVLAYQIRTLWFVSICSFDTLVTRKSRHLKLSRMYLDDFLMMYCHLHSCYE